MDNKRNELEIGKGYELPYLKVLDILTRYGNQHTEGFIIDQLVNQSLKDDVNLVDYSPDIELWAYNHLFSCLNEQIEELSRGQYSLDAIEKLGLLSLLLFDSFPPEFVDEISKEFGSQNWFRDFAHDTNLLVNENNGNITTQYVLQKYKGIIIERMGRISPIWNIIGLINIRNICQQEKYKDNLGIQEILQRTEVYIKEFEVNMSTLSVFQSTDDLGGADGVYVGNCISNPPAID